MKSVCGKSSLLTIAISKQLLEIGGEIVQNGSELSWFIISGDGVNGYFKTDNVRDNLVRTALKCLHEIAELYNNS